MKLEHAFIIYVSSILSQQKLGFQTYITFVTLICFFIIIQQASTVYMTLIYNINTYLKYKNLSNVFI